MTHADSTRGEVMTIEVPYCGLDIDENILYRGHSERLGTFHYVERIVDMNRDRLQHACKLASIKLGTELVTASGAPQRLRMLCDALRKLLGGPLFTWTTPPGHAVALRLLNATKRDFSAQTGCWMHFIWPDQAVAVYGLSEEPARKYLDSILQKVAAVPAEGSKAANRLSHCEYPRKNVGQQCVEYSSQAKCVIQFDNAQCNTITLQLHGTASQIELAQNILSQEIFVCVSDGHPVPHNVGFPENPMPPTVPRTCTQRRTALANRRTTPQRGWGFSYRGQPQGEHPSYPKKPLDCTLANPWTDSVPWNPVYPERLNPQLHGTQACRRPYVHEHADHSAQFRSPALPSDTTKNNTPVFIHQPYSQVFVADPASTSMAHAPEEI